MAVLASDRQVVFTGAGEVPLPGTLVIPDRSRPVPAMLLIAGSGPTDRDGNQLPHLRSDLLRLTAEVLAACGIASLRYDKRGVGAGAERLPREPDALAAFVRWDRFVGDAAAALAFLRSQDGVDGERVGVLGHSEGGLIGLDLAAGSGAPPAALVLAATPGRPIAAVLRDQLARLARSQGAAEPMIAALLDENDAILARLAAGQGYPPAVSPGLAGLYPAYLAPFWTGLAALDPAALAARCNGPILLLAGQADVQVLADKDMPALAEGFARRTVGLPPTIAVVAKASHNLKAAGPDPQGVSGPLHPDVPAILTDWFTRLSWTTHP